MANIFNIAPPTEEEIKSQPVDSGNISTLDPRASDLPKGTTPEQATVELQQKVLPSRVTGKMEDAPEGYSGVNLGYLNDFARGFNDIVLALPDMAINAVAEGLESAGVVEPNTVDRNYLSRLFNSSDYESQTVIIPYLLHYGTGRFGGQAEEEGMVSSIVRSGGQATGLAIPFYGASSRTAQASAQLPSALAARTAPSTLSTGQLVRESFLSPYRTAPLATAGIEGSLAAVSGMGAETEKQVFGTETGIGAMTPLVAPALYYGLKTAVTKGPVGRTFSWAKDKTVGAYDEAQVLAGKKDPGAGEKGAVARGELEKEVQAAGSTPEGFANIQKATDIEVKLNPYADEPIKLSPAEQTMDKPLLATQQRLEASGTPEFTRANADRKANALTATQRFIDGELTGSPVDDAPLWVFDQATGRYNLTVGRLDNAEQTLTTNWAKVTNADTGVYPSLSAETSTSGGANLRQTIVEAHEAAKADALKLAKKLNINNADQLGSADSLDAAQTAVRNQLVPRAGDESLSYSGLAGPVKKFLEFGGKRVSFQDWKGFRDQVSSEIGKQAALGNKTQMRQLAVLAEELDKMAMAYGRTNEKFNEFRTWYDTNVILPFERSGVIKVTSKSAGSTKDTPQYYLPDERVADAFLEDSNTARQFMTIFGQNENQMSHMRGVLLDKLRTQAYDPNTATFNPDKVNGFLNKNKEVLTELGLADEFSNTQQMLANMVQRQADLTARRRIVNSNMLMKTIARLQNTDSPEKLLDSALNNPGLMAELRDGVTRGGPTVARDTTGLTADEAGQAFRAAVTERMLARAPDAMANPAAFKAWMVKNERVLNSAFDKSHIDNMYLVADAAERILATGMPEGAGMQPADIVTRLTSSLGTTPAGISNRFIAVQEGRLGPKAAVGYVLSRAIRQRSSARSDALFREMMFNPELAKTLATEGGESIAPLGISEPLKRRLNLYMFNIGVDYGDELRPEVGTNTFVVEPNVPDKPITVSPPVEESKPENQMPDFTPIKPPPIVPYQPLNNIKPPPVIGDQTSVDPSLLFPNDSTSIAIAKRRAPQSGIATI